MINNNRCKYISLIVVLFFTVIKSKAQIIEGAKWSFNVEQKENGIATLIFKAKTNEKFHIYSQFLPSNDGPIATTFTFKATNDYECIGKVEEGTAVEAMDEAFQMKVRYFVGEVVFKQKIKVKAEKHFKVTGVLNYMACDNMKCLPPTDVEFTFDINK